MNLTSVFNLFLIFIASLTSVFGADYVFIVNGTGSVAVFDAATNMPVAGSPFATTPMPGMPPNNQITITINPSRTRIYVPSFQADGGTTVAVMDINSTTGALSHIAGSPFGGFSAPFQAAITSDGNFVFMTNSGTDEILVFDPDLNPLGMPISTGVGTSPHGIVLSPDGTTAYVACTATSQIKSYTVSSSAPYLTLANTASSGSMMTPGMTPYVVAVNSAGTVYATNFNGVVTRFNAGLAGAPFAVAASMSFLVGIAFDPDNSRIYVADPMNNQILVLDSTTLLPVPIANPISSQGSTPFIVALNSDRMQLYITNVSTNDISIRDNVHDTYPAIAGSPFGGLNVPYDIAFSTSAIPPSSPTNLSGKQVNNDFGIVYELSNTLQWSYADASQIAGFFVYRNGVKIATLPPSARAYEDHNTKKGVSYTYTVTAFNQDGDESAPIAVTVR